MKEREVGAVCGHAFHWPGAYLAMPPCPKCGWRPPLAELQRLQQLSDLLAGRRPGEATEGSGEMLPPA